MGVPDMTPVKALAIRKQSDNIAKTATNMS
jgi:hypothetical protein